MGQIPNMVCAKDSRIKVEIPAWLKVFESKEFYLKCVEVDSEGKTKKEHCEDMEIFIDNN